MLTDRGAGRPYNGESYEGVSGFYNVKRVLVRRCNRYIVSAVYPTVLSCRLGVCEGRSSEGLMALNYLAAKRVLAIAAAWIRDNRDAGEY